MPLPILTAGLLILAAPALAEDPVWTLSGFTGPESVTMGLATGKIFGTNCGTDPMKKGGEASFPPSRPMASWRT
jgi:hypothetical protein